MPSLPEVYPSLMTLAYHRRLYVLAFQLLTQMKQLSRCELFYLAMNNSARISISSTYSIIYRKRKCFCKSERSIFTYKPAKRMCIITVNRAMSTSDCSDMIRFSYLWNKINKLRLSLRFFGFIPKTNIASFSFIITISASPSISS